MTKFKAMSVTVRAPKNIANDKPCTAASESIFDPNGKYAIIAISQGCDDDSLDNAENSKSLALDAVNCVHKYFSKVDSEGSSLFVNNFTSDKISDREREEILVHLKEETIQRWNVSLNEIIKKNDYQKRKKVSLDKSASLVSKVSTDDSRLKAYGKALLVAAVYQDFWFGFQYGEGNFAIYKNGEFYSPGDFDEKWSNTHINYISDDGSINQFHLSWSFERPDAILLVSGGLKETLEKLNLFPQFHINTINISLQNWDEYLNELPMYLTGLSAIGATDDFSISGIINLDINPKVNNPEVSSDAERVILQDPYIFLSSMDAYRKICEEGKDYFLNYEKKGLIKEYPPAFRQAYFSILKTIIYELTVFKKSDLIHAIKVSYGLASNPNDNDKIYLNLNFDGYLIILGLYSVLTKNTESDADKIYFQSSGKIFRRRRDNKDANINGIMEEMQIYFKYINQKFSLES
jgi:hypothetical protein